LPVSCFVFAFLGLALGASARKDGKLASFVLGIGVIFAYYVIMITTQSLTKGFWIPAWLSTWIPDIVLGIAGVVLLWSRARSADQPIRFPMPAFVSRRGAKAGQATQPGRSGSRPLVKLRVPNFELPRPTVLDTYVSKQYLKILGMTMVGMLGLFYISTFIDLSDKLFKGQTTLLRIGEFLMWSTPQFLSYIIALSVMLSALVTVGLLTKNSELIVMRACGVSLYRTALPMIAFALGGSAVLFLMEENVLAVANQRAERLRYEIRTGNPKTFGVLNRKWIAGNNGEVFHYQYYDPKNRELNNLSVFQFDPQSNRLASRLFAERARFNDQRQYWYLDEGWNRTFDPNGIGSYERYEGWTRPFEPPDYFVTEAREPDLMNFGQLRRYITELQASGYDVLEHQVGLHRKIAFPFVTLVMTLIAVPFAVTTGRRGAMYGIGVGIVLALVYWTMISVFAAFGQGGLIDPVLAAWAPNLVFGAAAAYLLLTVRT
jgi:LPS export ABC transporter permease LptG